MLLDGDNGQDQGQMGGAVGGGDAPAGMPPAGGDDQNPAAGM